MVGQLDAFLSLIKREPENAPQVAAIIENFSEEMISNYLDNLEISYDGSTKYYISMPIELYSCYWGGDAWRRELEANRTKSFYNPSEPVTVVHVIEDGLAAISYPLSFGYFYIPTIFLSKDKKFAVKTYAKGIELLFKEGLITEVERNTQLLRLEGIDTNAI